MKKLYFTLFLIIYSCNIFGQKSISISTKPADADVYSRTSNGDVKIGTKGAAVIEMPKSGTWVIVVKKEGFADVVKTYIKQKNGATSDVIELLDRVITINTNPSDAKIFINNVDMGTSKYKIFLPKGETVSVEVRKKGFPTISRVFHNKEGFETPPVSYVFTLEDRIMNIKSIPVDASIFVDDKKIGEGNIDAKIEKDKCIKVRIEKTGFVPVENTYCNKENDIVPPLQTELVLKDRIVQINTPAEDTKIFVDGREMGKGNYAVKIPDGKCTEILIKKESYITQKMELCNKKEYQEPEAAYSIKLIEDDAFRESEQSNIANINFSVEVKSEISKADAWQTLASIIQSKFDEIETIDGTTSYLRTNWSAKEYRYSDKTGGYSLNNMIVRTRVVVTNGGSNPLKFNVKIQSELSIPGCNNLNAQNDQCFEPWPRILRKYNDLISEIQRRLQ
jgi:hypothetical protein